MSKTNERIVVDLNAIYENYAAKQHKVVLHNDDYTPMEYVILVLTSIFHKSVEDAVSDMLEAHSLGSSVIGSYDQNEAIDLVDQANALNDAFEMQLRLTIES